MVRRTRLSRSVSKRMPTVSESDLVLLGEVLNVVEDKSPAEKHALKRVEKVLQANLRGS